MTRLDPLGCEPLGIEALRILPQPGIAVGEVGADRDHAAGTNGVPPDLVVGERRATERERRRKQPHRLLDDHAGIGQRFDVGEGRLSVAGHPVDLVVQRAFDPGMSRQQVQRPRQRQRRRLVSGGEERQHFVTELRIGHPFTGFLVARGEEQAQQIGRSCLGGAACGDDAVNRPVEPRERRAGARRAPPGEPLREAELP